MKFIPYYALLTVLALSGCITPYQTNFDCPVPIGVPCTSMTKINHMIDQGLLGKEDAALKENDCNCETGVHLSEEGNRRIKITHFQPKIEPTLTPEMPIGYVPGEVLEVTEEVSALEPIQASESQTDVISEAETNLDLFDSLELIQPPEKITEENDVRESS